MKGEAGREAGCQGGETEGRATEKEEAEGPRERQESRHTEKVAQRRGERKSGREGDKWRWRDTQIKKDRTTERSRE